MYVLVVTVVMKNTRPNIRPPKRSSSLVSRITRPIIEQQLQRAPSPASSFSSSILTKGMSDRITPPPSPLERLNKSTLSKSSNQRTVDFSRRRTIASTSEHNSNKENLSTKCQEQSRQDTYRFSPSLSSASKNKVEVHIPSTKHVVTKQYYFQSYPTETNEDLLNNSYGLTLLKQQAAQPVKPRHSVATVLMVSQVSNNAPSEKQYNPQNYLQQGYTLESLEDLLCDREVESYFYPTSPLDHLYMNYENSTNSYQLPLAYVHETLC